MKIAVIGADSRTGQAFVRHALAAGHSVQAGIIGQFPVPPHPALRTLRCDATKLLDVERLLEGQEVVVSLIGHVSGSPPDIQTQAMQVIYNAMTEKGLRRLVSLTGTGVRFPGDVITGVDKAVNKALKLIDADRIADGRTHARFLATTNLDWTIIRVLKLTNGVAHRYVLTTNGPTKPYVSRDEVALAILEVLEKGSFIHRAPIISPPSAA